MNFPRFSNPHLRAEQYETVSRSTLLESDAEDHALADRTQVEALAALVKRALGDFTVSEPPRKKRKKHTKTTRTESIDTVVSFRLLSSAPVREYSLAPKPHPEINNEGPPCEDDAASAELRRAQAAAVAVDFDWVLREGRLRSRSRKQAKGIHVKTVLPDPPPRLALLERHRSIHPVRLQLKPGAKPSPHETKVESICPVLVIPLMNTPPSPSTLSETARRRLRRQKKRTNEKTSATRPQATFWRPSLSKNGCVGYAMGYEGSWAVEGEEEKSRIGYARDSMKKAEWVHSAS